MEDLDSLITDFNRSFFLNELDGFANNDGLCILATTNHPELLDPAIIERPSRFDRKYHFTLPAAPERERYVRQWFSQRAEQARPTDETLAKVAAECEGFSFAYLKELCMSSVMQWIEAPDTHSPDQVLRGQLKLLRAQMSSRRVAGLVHPESRR
jgi:ATP-dependent 26S proteasome regulatory subunit